MACLVRSVYAETERIGLNLKALPTRAMSWPRDNPLCQRYKPRTLAGAQTVVRRGPHFSGRAHQRVSDRLLNEKSISWCWSGAEVARGSTRGGTA